MPYFYIILHPFVALRRTCQVNRKCSPLMCVQPFSLMPFMYRQQRKQGIFALYKGLSSELLVNALMRGTETALANHLEWQREIHSKRYFETLLKNMVLRGFSAALCTPFLCTSVIETVQSVVVVKDRPSFIDCVRDGFLRLLHLRSTPSNRMLPIWLLIVPTVLYHVSHIAIKTITEKCVELSRRFFIHKLDHRLHHLNAGRPRRNQANLQADTSEIPMNLTYATTMTTATNDCSSQQDITLVEDSIDTSLDVESFGSFNTDNISSSIIGCLVADVALLPVESVLNSLYIQGTRTIIDNCDETTVVLPVLTNYDGFSDCYQSIIRFEGYLGLYKGLGAIILQYTAHYLLFRLIDYLLKEFKMNSTKAKSYRKSLFKTSRGANPTTTNTPNSDDNEFIRFVKNNNARHSTPHLPPNDYSRYDESKYWSLEAPTFNNSEL